ncbi:hypothetical protein NX059_010725 [Plenodomus lindquistii]|nr:hypothetical protein NX059_010725 [Plenodomus lindquistii]
MAPTTRAAAKRKRERSLSKATSKRSNVSDVAKEDAEARREKALSQNTHSTILTLPAEIRNNIYTFCTELPWDEESPLLTKGKSARATPRGHTGRQYFALTQVCQQIRCEYRPLWLRDSSVRIMFKDLHPFMHIYYHDRAQYQNAPRFLCISWDHSSRGTEYAQFDIGILLDLIACCPTLTIRFVCHRLVESDLPNQECPQCGHSLYCGCEEFCDHEAAYMAAIETLHEHYSYLEELNAFLAHRNEAWLQQIRANEQLHHMKVQFTFEIDTPAVTIYILFHHYGSHAPKLDVKDMWKSGVTFLKQMGMIDMPDGINAFVLGESTAEFMRTRPGADLQQTYNQVHIRPWRDLVP